MRLWELLLAPALAGVARVVAAAAASTPVAYSMAHGGGGGGSGSMAAQPLARNLDTELSAHLRLLEVVLTSSCTHSGTGAQPAAAAAGAAGHDQQQQQSMLLKRIFLQQVWPHCRTLLASGAHGAFLRPACACLSAVLRGTAGAADWAHLLLPTPAVAATPPPHPAGAASAVAAWAGDVASVLCGVVGRPGAGCVHEPLALLLAACSATSAPERVHAHTGSSSNGSSSCTASGQETRRPGLHGAAGGLASAVLPVVQVLLVGPLAAALSCGWRAADQQPETAEALLRIATAVARMGLPERLCSCSAGGGGGCGCGAGRELVPGWREWMACAGAALRLAAASSCCEHRQAAAVALGCTAAVLGVVCEGPASGWEGGGVQGGPCARAELVAVLVPLGPAVASGLLGECCMLQLLPMPAWQQLLPALVPRGRPLCSSVG